MARHREGKQRRKTRRLLDEKETERQADIGKNQRGRETEKF
jgi:hypothetical protein